MSTGGGASRRPTGLAPFGDQMIGFSPLDCPIVAGPRDVPALREWMLQEWFPGNVFARSAGIHVAGRDASEGEMGTTIAWNLQQTVLADLWWIDAAMSDLIQQTSLELPHVILRPELVPASPVLVVFEKPVWGSDADGSDKPVMVDAFLWGWAELRQAGPSIATTMYQRLALDKPNERGRGNIVHVGERGEMPDELRLRGEVWVPIGRTHWVVGEDWSARISDEGVPVSDVSHASMIEDRRWLATLWSLAQEPRIASTRLDLGHRGERRRAERAGARPPTVKVVSLRHTVHANAGATASGEGRTYHVQWPVRGHWRQQPYGPGRKFRRPQFIAPYLKGPEDAPLRKGAVVKVLRDE